MRRNPGLIIAINLTAQLAETTPNVITDEVRRDLLSALEHLLSEVELPDLKSIDAALDQGQVFKLEERPHAFAAVSELAAALQRLYLTDGLDIPEILKVWQREAETSKLPEVREVYEGMASAPKDENSEG